ncbi:nuclear transport factor 2 family protein [Rhodocytophaga rosea]|uniref:Nuclear transport factor 2 family protein n=1 Tax=Rhodocytophaga rosea TaxID=2704465 RepID=A0A6C0GQD9_9BACT|nr:nuclear transport factor 2 family protein [Rhodocytophaga rosea]QHT70286.1 nuclear transport factor 2 family protein [Rhodocytophaga rosea]
MNFSTHLLRHFFMFSIWLLALPALAQKTEDELLQTQVRRFEAMIENDQTELEQLLASDLVYTHSNAVVENKQEFLATLKSQKLIYRSVQPDEVKVRLLGSVGIITGRADVVVEQEGKTNTLHLRFMDVYAKRKGHWQQVSWQSTRIPEQ